MHGRVSETSRDESSDARQGLGWVAIALFVGVLVIFADLARGGPLLHLDAWTSGIWTFKGPYDYPFADGVDRIGQRLICLPLLFVVAYVLSRRLRSIRPLVIAVGATFALNFVVGILKLASGRESPRTGGPELFVGDNVLFPSGHTANVIFVYGLLVALLFRYGDVRVPVRRLLVAGVAFIGVLMTVISVYRHTHWLSDLVAGAMIGGAMLQISLAADAGWSEVVRRLKRIAGPGWVVVQWVVSLLRRPVVPRARRVPEMAPPKADAAVDAADGTPGDASGDASRDSTDEAPRPPDPRRGARVAPSPRTPHATRPGPHAPASPRHRAGRPLDSRHPEKVVGPPS